MPHAIRTVIGLFMPHANVVWLLLGLFLLHAVIVMSLCLQCISHERICEVKLKHSIIDASVTEAAYHVDAAALYEMTGSTCQETKW